MAGSPKFQLMDAAKWRSLVGYPTENGYVIGEDLSRFKREAAVEVIMRTLAIAIVLIALAQWSIPDWIFPGEAMAAKAVISVAFASVGLGLYLFATRGFRTELNIDLKNGEIRIGRRNGMAGERIGHKIDMMHINSLFVRRPEKPGQLATLHARLKGRPSTLRILSGSVKDIEELHGILCHDMRQAFAPHTQAASARTTRTALRQLQNPAEKIAPKRVRSSGHGPRPQTNVPAQRP